MSYVDDGMIIVQFKTWGTNLTKLRSAYGVVFELTQALGLVLEHNKSEVFHFPERVGTLTLWLILATPPSSQCLLEVFGLL